MNKQIDNPKKQAEWWQVLAILTISLFIIQMIGERFTNSTIGLENAPIKAQLSAFFLSMLNPVFWLKIAAPICYATAIFNCSAIFGAIAKGQEFTQSIINGLEKTGNYLAYGALFDMALTPTLIEWISARGGLKLQSNTENLLIMLLGGLLYAIAKQGNKIRSELESII